MLNATAVSMKTSIDYLSYVGAYNGPVIVTSGAVQKRQSKQKRVATSTPTIIVVTEATIPLSSTTYTDTASLYNGVNNNLQSAVTTGAFDQTLQTSSNVNNAGLTTASVASVSSSPATVSYPPSSSSNDRLSDGAIAGIVIGTVVGFALLVAAAYFAYIYYIAHHGGGAADYSKQHVGINL